MNAQPTSARQDIATYALAIFSLATFWVLPFSPFISMAAVHRTKSTTGWARRLSVAGAVMCSVYTLVLGGVMYWMTFLVLTGRIHS